jgi:N-acetylneuraminic acid mutarotase
MSRLSALLLVLILLATFSFVLTKPVLSLSNDVSENYWITKAPMPTARALFGTAVYQNEIYCIGGYFSMIVPYNDKYGTELNITYHDSGENQVYNPVTNNWKSKAQMPTPRYFAATTILYGKIYVFGGETMTNLYSYLNVTEVYDIKTDSWAKKSPAPLPVEGGASAAVVDDKIYVLGVSAKDQTIMEVYDPLNDSWSVGNPAPVSLTSTAVTTSGLIAPQRIYFFGENSTEIYDAVTNDWATGAPEPTDRLIGMAAAVNDLIYLIGGRSGENGQITLVSPVIPSALNEQYTPLGYGTIPPVTTTEPEHFPTTVVTIVTGASFAVISAALLVYFKKRIREVES